MKILETGSPKIYRVNKHLDSEETAKADTVLSESRPTDTVAKGQVFVNVCDQW